MSRNAWVTLATNDSYSLGALVLAHSLKRSNTAHKLAVLITPAVSQPMREQLQTVFDVVKTVDVLDSKDEAHLALMKRPELGITFTKIHCWRLTEFEKCVFLDADTLVVRNCDELFEREEFSAAPDVSWPDCFNSGVFVYKPSVETFNQLLQFAVEKGSFDGGDQGLLNQFFSDWATKDIKKHLPFVYNLTSVAAYSYIPAFKQYGAETRIVHFIGTGKPWLQQLDPSTRTITPTSGSEHLAPLLQQWWDLFCEKVHPNLSKNLENNNDGMSHPPVEVCSNTPVTLISDEPQSPGLIEPCVQYREKDDYRQFNLPYQPFDVRGSSGELLNVEFLLASVEPTEESTNENQVEEKDTKPEVQEEVEEVKETQPEFDDKEEEKGEESVPKDPFDYETFFPDEKCVNNYLEQNVVTYQPYETRQEEPHENIPLPRFLTMPEDDQRQKGNVEVVEYQPAPEPPPPPAPPTPILPPDPPKQEVYQKEPTPPPVEKHELLKSKSMTFIPSDINTTDSPSPPHRSIWKSQPNVNVDPNRKYSMPKLKPILPRQNSKIIPTPVSRVTLYTEILMSADYKDPVDLPKDKVGFVETELRRSKSEADLKGKFGPLPYTKSPEVEIPQPKKTPFREIENDAYDLSRCKRQLGNKPRDHRKENITSKLITPTKERKSNVIKKRKSKELSPNDGGKEKPAKKERKERSRHKRTENVDEILKRLWEFSKNYQHYFGIDGQSGTKERPIQSEFKQFRNFVKGQKETTQKGLLGIQDIINEKDAKVRTEGSTCVKEVEGGLENDVSSQTSESQCTRVEETETIQCEKKSVEPTNNDRQSVDPKNISNVQTPSEFETTGQQTNFDTTEKSSEVIVAENTRTDSETHSIKNLGDGIVENDSTQEEPTNGCTSPSKECPSEAIVLEESIKDSEVGKDVSQSPEIINISEEPENTIDDSLDTLPTHESRIVEDETEKVEAPKEPETSRNEIVQTNGENPCHDPSEVIEHISEVSLSRIDTLESTTIVEVPKELEETSRDEIQPNGESLKNGCHDSFEEIETPVVSPSRTDEQERRIVNGETEKEAPKPEETIQTNGESLQNGYSPEKPEQIKSVVLQPDDQESTMIVHGETDRVAPKEPEEAIQTNGVVRNGCSSESRIDIQESTQNEEDQVNTPEVQIKTPSETSLQENGSQHSEPETPQDVQNVSNDTTSVPIEPTPKGMFTIGSPEKTTQLNGEDSSRPNGNTVPTLQPAQISKLLKGKGKMLKPDEILCVPDFDTPRSSRILALTPTTDTDAIPQAPPSSPVTTPRKARIQRKPYENGTKYRSPVGKKTPKDSAGIAGAIAQLNLESGGQSAGSEATNAAHQEYIRRQNWETGNMDYMGRDSFDNIWSKICQTLEGKELDNATEGTTKSTEEKTKPVEGGTEAPVSLTTILEKCPEFIDTLPSESVTGPVEEDEIIFSKPENRQKCLTNIKEEEEGGAAEGKSVKLSDILKPEMKKDEKQELGPPQTTAIGEEVNQTKPGTEPTQSESKPVKPEIAIQPPTPECTTVAIRQPVYIPGAPTDDQTKTPAQKIAEKKQEQKPETPTEPIPLPAPVPPNECKTVAIAYPPVPPPQGEKEISEEAATEKVTKEEKQKKGVFSKILEIVGVAPKAEEGSKSVFYDVEGKPTKVEEGLEVTETGKEAPVTDTEKESKLKEVSEVKEPVDKGQEGSEGRKDGDKVPEKVKDEKELKPGQAPMPKPERKAPGSSMPKKSPSPIAAPETAPETEPTPPEPPKRRNSAVLKADEAIPDTPEPKKSEVENIIEKAKTEVENILQTAEKESSDLINTMKLMIGAEGTTKPEETEELKVTTEEERQRHKGEVVTSKLSDQILKAIPPPRRKAISESKEASGSSGAIPKTPSPGEKPKPKPSSIPVPPPRNKGKPSTPAPPKGKTKK